MTDVFSRQKRSLIMSRVRSAGNLATEFAFLTLLKRHRITGWRRRSRVFGKPDFVFPSKQLAVFIDGCFWHGCPKHGSQPMANKAFWRAKLARNRTRDHLVERTLKKQGWRVLRVWQHELTGKNEARLTSRVQQALHH
jgi:DNA mismatch endonuclease, patch repair protein